MRVITLPHKDAKDELQHQQSLSWIEESGEAVLALGRNYPAGFRVPLHSHTKTQLWCAREGVVLVGTARGSWMLPPGHGLVIPAGLEHSTEMVSDVRMQSLYVETTVVAADDPRVVEVTPLAGNLMEELVQSDAHPIAERRKRLIMELLLDEVGRLPERPLGLPFPADARLARLCHHFLKRPAANASIDDWAVELGMSRRSFTRFFRAETGLSFVTWRQQACLFASLPRLAEGQSVTTVALDAGYENIAAFTTMFRRMLGSSPSNYLKARVG
ncbi:MULTISPECIES: helix-turn-helix transcriptional regulator [unclassified Rhizobium]|uniref:AraC family transcriptional regulator n=1 Tax=unclassified Rhizobium TaxID=2613769 RepID=UPI0006FF127C|nr:MULTISPECIES: helix-turn-helix transcriptional regulator [unclassified Rhizobium]KQV43702.1 AraC family transcriptional regulator [Rhizobium sp. Root1212]KRD37886.1 AraC family transcriptional regulator [Rhizobium sp. Root268]